MLVPCGAVVLRSRFVVGFVASKLQSSGNMFVNKILLGAIGEHAKFPKVYLDKCWDQEHGKHQKLDC